MKAKDVKIGGRYHVKVSGRVVIVRLTAAHSRGGWNGINEATGREIRIKTAARLRSSIEESTAADRSKAFKAAAEERSRARKEAAKEAADLFRHLPADGAEDDAAETFPGMVPTVPGPRVKIYGRKMPLDRSTFAERLARTSDGDDDLEPVIVQEDTTAADRGGAIPPQADPVAVAAELRSSIRSFPTPERAASRFTVRSNVGWGWRIPEASYCPSFGYRTEAQRYADLRNDGHSHLVAWDRVEAERPDDPTAGDPK